MPVLRTSELDSPRVLETVHWLILCYGFQPGNVGVCLQDLFQNIRWLSRVALWNFRFQVAGTAVEKDSFGVMEPVFKLALIFSLWLNKLVIVVGRIKRLNLKLRPIFFSRFSKLEHALGHNSRTM